MTNDRAYYNPAVPVTEYAIAAQAAGAPSTPPVFTPGLEMPDMVVASDFSRCIYGFIGGKQKWRKDYTGVWPRGLEVWGGYVWVANGTTIELLHPLYGNLIKTVAIPGGAAGPINSIRITQSPLGNTNFTWLTLCFDIVGANSVRTYKLTGSNPCDWALTLFLSNPHSANSPRSALVDTGWLWVADTFGHRVYAVDLASAGMRPGAGVIPAYYPNMVDFVSGSPDKLIIAEEHGNRILQVDYDPAPYNYSIIASAPVAPYNDPTKFKADFVALEAGTVDPASTFTPKKSKCATECSGINTLYSPNSARKYGNDYLIADCDNQRVVVWGGGAVKGELTGLNNPTNAVLL